MAPDEVRARRLAAYAAYGAIESLPMPAIAVVHGRGGRLGLRHRRLLRFCHRHPGSDLRHARGAMGDGRRHPAAAAHPRQAAGQGHDVHRPQASAEEARAAGLVARIVDAAALDGVIADIAKTIVGAPQAALRQAKSCIDQGVELDPRGALALELQAMEENIARDTWRAGMSRFGGDKR